jgi:hypothetical protein
LRGAAQTAAGVAAGALAFEGISSLFSHPGFGGGGGLGQAGFMGGGQPVEETVVNNYYDSPTPEGRQGERLADTSDDQNYRSDDNDDNVQTEDASYDDSNDYSDDSSSSDDSSDVA